MKLWSVRISAVIYLLGVCLFEARSQFTEVYAGSLPPVLESSVAWGDYDNDGDLDIVVGGYQLVAGSQLKVFENTGSGFSLYATLTGFEKGTVVWGDYDNDGKLDLLACGLGTSTIVYRNVDTAFAVAATLPNVTEGASSWADIDNDGDLDIVLTGNNNSTYIAKIYRNTGGSFSEVFSGTLSGVVFSAVAWGDYDNDGYVDLVVAGSLTTKLYHNDAGAGFTEVFSGTFAGVTHPSLDWGDYDNDGDLDLVQTGSVGSSYVSTVYQNSGSGFTAATSLTGVEDGSARWGDFDNDGDLDIALTGLPVGARISKLYRNDGANVFTDTLSGSWSPSYKSSLAWGDFDNDGDLDLLLTGESSSAPTTAISAIYRNDIGAANSAPSAPSEWNASLSGNGLTFTWNDGTDTQTPTAGLSYNLRVGTTNGGTNVVSPNADTTGLRRIPAVGNVGQVNAWTLEAVQPATTYYWSVQSIDHAFAGSAFATEQLFVTEPSVQSSAVSFADVTQNSITVRWTNGNGTRRLALMNAGAPVSSTPTDQTTYTANTVFGTGTEVGTGNFVVASGTADSVVVTGLSAGVRYHVALFEYAGPNGAENYLTTSPTTAHRATQRYSLQLAGGLPGITSGTIVLGDDDSDGDLDLFVAGYDVSFNETAKILHRSGSTYVEAYAGDITGLYDASAAWGDLDNDGLLDLAVVGSSTALYHSTGAGFVEVYPGTLPARSGSSIAWGDMDQDGRADLVVTGTDGSMNRTTILRNTGSGFVEVFSGAIAGVSYGSVAWDDFDDDGDPDLLLAGSGSARLYRNDGNGFTEVQAGTFTPVSNASADWGDYDNDGDLDVLLTGTDGTSQPISKIYQNSAGVFSEAFAGVLEGVAGGTALWADLDGDGDRDILLTGATSGGSYVMLAYENAGGSFLSLEQDTLTGLADGSAAVGDLDNDGDLDIVIAGSDSVGTPATLLYRNDGAVVNSTPGTPSALNAVVAGAQVTLSWTKPSDAETPTSGLTTGIRVGTSPGGSDVVAPFSNTANGYRRIPQNGSAGHVSSWVLKNLAPGTYYWSAQAVDASFSGSSFATEASFAITLAEPTVQASGVVFSSIRATSLTVTWSGGNGSKRIVLMRAGGAVTSAPVDGVGYAANAEFGVGSEIGSGNFVVSSDDANTVHVTGLDASTTYHVSVFEYAGTDGQADFLTSSPATGSATTHNFAEDFTGALEGVDQGSAAWGDYDNDGDLDVIVTGFASAASTKLYQNTGSGFAEAYAGAFAGTFSGSVAWGDYDNDGDLDVLLSGNGSLACRVYQNTGTGFTEVYGGSFGTDPGETAVWGDMDNDGRLDIVATINGGSTLATKFYRNTGSGYTEIYSGQAVGVYESSLALGDYDGDGMLDLALTGDQNVFSPSPTSRLYRNTGSGFAEAYSGSLTGVVNGSVAWADFDNDGDLDLALAGQSISGNIARVYQNNGSGFTEVFAGTLAGIYAGDVSWGDIDNDGDADLLVAGGTFDVPSQIATLYENTGSGFVEIFAGSLSGVANGSAAWGDMDADGDLDLIVVGSGTSKFYRNSTPTANSAPAVPGGLNVTYDAANSATLRWERASDGTTPAAGLSYNLRMGTSSGSQNIVPSMSDSGTGLRRLPALGNAHQDTAWTISGLSSATTYYWSVQSIDQGFSGSSFSGEASFTLPTAPPIVATGITANISSNSVTLQGTLTAGFVATQARFLYGTSPGVYTDSVDAEEGLLNDAGPTLVTAEITDLTTGGTYYWRAVAESFLGYSTGTESTFTTTVPASMTVPGTALTLDGSHNPGAANHTFGNLAVGTGTVEAWVRTTDSTTEYRGIAGKAGAWELALAYGYASISESASTAFVADGAWHHLALSFQSGVSNGTVLYVDGIPVKTTTVSYSTFYEFRLGAAQYVGEIDEVRVWNVARSAQQIRESMHRIFYAPQSGLLANWQFNEGTGSTATDFVSDIALSIGSPTWTTSTISAGTGTSTTETSFTTGTAELGTVSLTMTDDFDNAVDLVGTEIRTPPNALPMDSLSTLKNRYFIINALGTPGTFSTDVTFEVPSTFTSNGRRSSANYQLYHRSLGSDGAWTKVASSASAHTATTVTFSGITQVGQFQPARLVAPPINLAKGGVTEGAAGDTSYVQFTLRLSQWVFDTVRVRFQTVDSTATAGVDYVAVDTVLTFDPGVDTVWIEVPVLDDQLIEPHERFKGVISDPEAAELGAHTMALGIIRDDDEATLSQKYDSLIAAFQATASDRFTTPSRQQHLIDTTNFSRAAFDQRKYDAARRRLDNKVRKRLLPGPMSVVHAWVSHEATRAALSARATELYDLLTVQIGGGSQAAEAEEQWMETEEEVVPREFALHQNYPNPFNPATTIEFTLEVDGPASLRIYDILGRLVATPFEGEAVAGRYHRVLIDASQLPSGLYFYRLDAADRSAVGKMMLAK